MTPEVVTALDAYEATARTASPGARVPVEVRATVDDPYLAYRRARGDHPGAYLATTGGQSGWGYFGVEPAQVHSVGSDEVALPALAGFLQDETLVRGDCQVPYPCGLLGWLSYDVARDLESLPERTRRDRDLPRLQLAAYETLASWTEPRDGTTILRITSCPRIERPSDPADVRNTYEHGLEQAMDLATRSLQGDPAVGGSPAETDDATFESDCGEDAFMDRVRRVKSRIRAGDTFQANISHRLRAPAAIHPVETFEAVRDVNPAPYSALLEFPGIDLVSASPELLLRRKGDRVLTEPIAGTRPRGDTDEADTRLEEDLRTDAKERAEHAMLVDLERNDLGEVSQYGSVDVTEYRRVDRYAEVMHLVSRIEGRLRDGSSLADAIAAVFPGGTITGAPKPRTMEIIDEVEATRRGPYTGSIGIFGYDDRATLNIIIRTLVRYEAEYHLRVGAGIVHDSKPRREYAETLDKARALVNAVDSALDDRTAMQVSTPHQ